MVCSPSSFQRFHGYGPAELDAWARTIGERRVRVPVRASPILALSRVIRMQSGLRSYGPGREPVKHRIGAGRNGDFVMEVCVIERWFCGHVGPIGCREI